MPQVELNGNQSLYTQLTQNFSDSDSDDDDEVVRFQSNKSRGILAPGMANSNVLPLGNPNFLEMSTNQHRQIAPTAPLAPSRSSHTILLGLDGSEAASILNDGINSTNLQALEEETTSGHFIAASRRPMGPCRKACFCLSIIVCFASVALFLWALPCDNNLTCPAAGRRSEEDSEVSHNWIRDFEKVEFKSVISVSDGVSGYGKNLIFMYRSDKVFGEPSEVPQSQHRHHNGIIALVGSRGQIAWYHQMLDEPNRMDCGLLDVDRNGRNECLVIDEYGQLGCINPVSGQWLWHISLYQETATTTAGGNNSNPKSIRRKAIDLLDFPLILPDIDQDGVNDLLLVTSLEQIHHNNFLFVSGGANGRPIGKAYALESCEFVHKLNLEAGFNLIFNCINNDTEQTKRISLFELYKLATGGQQLRPDMLPTTNIEQHKFYGQRRNTANQRNIYSSSVADLIVENSGKCPFNCTMTMTVVTSGGATLSIMQGNGMYGMVPAVLATPKITGFVIKFWEWVEYEGSEREDSPSTGNRDQPESVVHQDEAHWSFINSERRAIPPRSKREDQPHEGPKNNFLKRKIKEHVILIFFNGTSHKVINTSQSDVVQFCRERTDGMNSFCQPDMNYQENSITIADLDQDGYKELISFYSTFVETDPEKWKLVTYVQQLRLETELMSLNDT